MYINGSVKAKQSCNYDMELIVFHKSSQICYVIISILSTRSKIDSCNEEIRMSVEKLL